MAYALLVAAFAGLVAVCFLPAITELRRPKDPGPLPIDQKRDITDRHFALAMRERVHGLRGPLVFDGDLRVAPGSLHDCEILAAGDATIGEGSRVHAIVAEGLLRLEEGVRVDSHAEGVRGLIVGPGASVHGRATSPISIVLEPGASVSHAAAPMIIVAGAAQVAAPAAQAPWTEDLAAALEGMLEAGLAFDAALRLLTREAGAEVSGLDALAHIAQRRLLRTAVTDAREALGVEWLGSLRGWYLGAATVRVRGDLVLPQGAVVPFHLIVEGDLAAGPGTRVHGGIYAERDVYMGPGSVVRGSVTARGDVRLAPRTWIGECVAAGAHAAIGASCSIGGSRSGGLTAEGRILLAEGVAVRNKLFALAGAWTLVPATSAEVFGTYSPLLS
jgi:predicted acyltransferase (DUF342 family)